MGPPGHVAIALALKPVVPKASLIVLMVATEIIDLLCFGFLAIGIEHIGENPLLYWSHGLFMSVVWSVLAGFLAFLFSRDRRISLVIGLLVFSHWVMDFISHTSDLPLLFSGSPLVGLGLENSLVAGLIMEFSLLAAGIAIYFIAKPRKVSEPKSR
jgi:hypothetical protein